MDKISALGLRNPSTLLTALGERLRDHRMARGWTQAELSQRAGIALSTLKLLESRGHGSLQRLARLAVALGIEGEMRTWFALPLERPSIDAVKLTARQRAPRRSTSKKETPDGTHR